MYPQKPKEKEVMPDNSDSKKEEKIKEEDSIEVSKTGMFSKTNNQKPSNNDETNYCVIS